jgi:hypothetical protein
MPTALRYPDFLCIGAQKAGTTWLHQALAGHPDLWLPPLKEIHYFDVLHNNLTRDPQTGLTGMDKARMEKSQRMIENLAKHKQVTLERMKTIHLVSLIGLRERTDEWYGSIFGHAPPEAKCGEITPEYAMLPPEGIRHVLRLSPKARFLFVMRDPIERAWSDLRMVRARQNPKAVPEMQRIKSRDFFARGDYAGTMEKYRAIVAPENFLAVYFDHIVENPRALLKAACEFLGVAFDRGEFSALEKPVHQGEQAPMEPEIYDALKDALKPAYDRLRGLDNPVVESWYRKHFA